MSVMLKCLDVVMLREPDLCHTKGTACHVKRVKEPDVCHAKMARVYTTITCDWYTYSTSNDHSILWAILII